jgi:hypothetical protein
MIHEKAGTRYTKRYCDRCQERRALPNRGRRARREAGHGLCLRCFRSLLDATRLITAVTPEPEMAMERAA